MVIFHVQHHSDSRGHYKQLNMCGIWKVGPVGGVCKKFLGESSMCRGEWGRLQDFLHFL